MKAEEKEMWVIIELMGHGQTAGIIRTSDLGGLLRVDVPMDDEGFRTEYYGEQAIYAIRLVSEEIARAYALPRREICAYNEPIVPRAQYEEALQKMRSHNEELQHQVDVLEKRILQINSLPSPKDEMPNANEVF